MPAARSLLRSLPAVDRLLGAEAWQGAPHVPPRTRREACRAVVAELRQSVLDGAIEQLPPESALVAAALARAVADVSPALVPVVNATGVVLHTNLGRAPLAPAALAALVAAGRYVNLEMDLDGGRRDHRMDRLASACSRVLGCGDVVVTNNCASAVFLVLKALAAGRPVAISRGEQVEIGGSFRMPDIMEASGATLVEVGTTNRTHLADYERAIDGGAELVLKVHRSNFELVGFTRSVGTAELAALCRERGVPLVYDFGSGLLNERAGLGGQSVGRALADGVDLVLFSGDKLLGGPQCGIVAGRRELVQQARRHPQMRMLRPGKLTMLALEATLREWERLPDGSSIPAAVLIARPVGVLQITADILAARLSRVVGERARVDVIPVDATPGGGSSATIKLPSRAVRLRPADGSEEGLASALRQGDPCVVGRREDGALLLDVRTLLDGDEDRVVEAVQRWIDGT